MQLRDTGSLRDLACAQVRILGNDKQHLGMIREERPCFAHPTRRTPVQPARAESEIFEKRRFKPLLKPALSVADC